MNNKEHAATLGRLERLSAIVMQTEQSLEDLHMVQADLLSHGDTFSKEIFRLKKIKGFLNLASIEAQAVLGLLLLTNVQRHCVSTVEAIFDPEESSNPGVTPGS